MVSGGDLIAQVLERQGVRFLYTLCGGHISPILVQCKKRGIRIVDVRDEANAVFAADATARLTGVPGVAAVTAGPGVTNTLTALKNAQMAQSPVVLLGGAAATMLKGRGSLQDIDQMAVIKAHVKWFTSASTVKELVPAVEKAFKIAPDGVPGPVFVECPIDLLYPQEMIKDWYMKEGGGKSKGLVAMATNVYLRRHLSKLFSGVDKVKVNESVFEPRARDPLAPLVKRAKKLLDAAERPALVVGSQALTRPREAEDLARAVERLGIPTWLAGMARGLLGRDHRLHMRHKRRAALKEADLVILAGVPCDFRMGYGKTISRKAKVISANLSVSQLVKNRVPTLPIPSDPGRFLQRLAETAGTGDRWPGWHDQLRSRDAAREDEIAEMAKTEAPPVNPIQVCRAIESAMADDSIIVADGGDFVGTAAYTLRPRGPLSWLDPGVFGTLGVGAGFALAAKLCRPSAEVWLIYGDGAAGFSMIEFDTFARHGQGVIAVVGNDAGWTQIARDQIEFLHDDVGTVLARTDYDKVAEGLGGVGLRIDDPDEIGAVLAEAKEAAKAGKPVLVNAHIGTTEFRKGSISM